MKHLKKYKIFESDEYRKDFEQDIKDICLELSDIHIHVNIGPRTITFDNYDISGITNKHFKFDLVKLYVLTLKDFLGDMYLSCEICYLSDSDYITEDFELSDDSEIYYDLSELVIKYKYK